MALVTGAAMVLYYDIEGDTADHDDWHTYEHLHERLSIPGFARATRWVATAGEPRYLVVYEVEDVAVATSPVYLARLNAPTPWTSSMMPRFRGMVRGFCTVVASAGYGLGRAALSVRFFPDPGSEGAIADRLAREVLPAMASRRGMGGVQLLRPAPTPPMTKEQSLRGRDAPMGWLLLATAYDADALRECASTHLDPAALARLGLGDRTEIGTYALDFTATAREVARTPVPPPVDPEARRAASPRR